MAITRPPFGASAASVGRNSALVAPSPCSITIGLPVPALIVETRPHSVLIVSKRSASGPCLPLVAARKPTPRCRLRRIVRRPARKAAMPAWRSPAARAQVAASARISVSGSWPSRALMKRWRLRWTSRSHPSSPRQRRTRARPFGMSKESRSKRSTSSWRLSGAALTTGSPGRKRASHTFGDTCWLLVPLDFDRESRHDLVPASPRFIYRNHFGASAHPRAGRNRGRKANLVPAVVHSEREALRLDQVLPEPVDHRKREVAMSDSGAEWALGLGPFHIHVNPLVVARHLRKGVDQFLAHFPPVAGPDLLPDELLQLIDSVRGDLRHRRRNLLTGSANRRSNTPR